MTFNGPLARDYTITPGFAHSGTQAVEVCFAQEFCTSPLEVSFTAGQAHAKVFVGYTAQLPQPARVTMQALDGSGAVVGQAEVALAAGTSIPVQNPLEINSASANIRRLVVGFAPANPGDTAFNNGLVVDDVEFGAAGPPPACQATSAPSVSLDQPPNAPEVVVQVNGFMLQGEVQTAAPLDAARLTIRQMPPPFPPNTRAVDLLSTVVQRDGGNFGGHPDERRPVSREEQRLAACGELRREQHGQRRRRVQLRSPPARASSFWGWRSTRRRRTRATACRWWPTSRRSCASTLSVTGPTASINEVGGVLMAHAAGRPDTRAAAAFAQRHQRDPFDGRQRQAARPDREPELHAAGGLDSRRHAAPGAVEVTIQGSDSDLPCDACGNVGTRSGRLASSSSTGRGP